MTTRLALPLAALLALGCALAGEKPASAPNVDDDFLMDEGLTSASATKAEKTPPNPAASEGLEAREGWRMAAWEDKGELAKLADPNKAGNTLLRLATQGGKMGKSGAVIGNVMLPAETGFMTVSAFNPGRDPVKIALGLFLFGETYYETAPQELPPGEWRALKFDLAARDFKCAATKWQHATILPKRVPVRSTVLLLFGGGGRATVFYDGVGLDCLKLPELKVGGAVQLGSEQARGAYAGYVASASAQGITVVGESTGGPAVREMRLQARRGGSAPEAYYQEFVDRSVLRQLMPGDAVQVGWCDVGGAHCVSWLNLVRQFPRTGKIAGRIKGATPATGGLEIEMTAVGGDCQYMVGKTLSARMPLNANGSPDPGRVALIKRAKSGMLVEIEYEHSPEYGVLIRSLKLPDDKPPAAPKPAAEPRKTAAPGAAEPD